MERDRIKWSQRIISKESWHLPILVAGVMHNIEPAHHALQQEGGVNRGEKKSRSVIRSDNIELKLYAVIVTTFITDIYTK